MEPDGVRTEKNIRIFVHSLETKRKRKQRNEHVGF